MSVGGIEIPQQVVPFVAVALGLGGLVLLMAIWRAMALYAETRGVRACLDGGDVSAYLERRSAFADCLRELVGSDVAASPVSADGVALLATDALEGVAHALTDRLRYWSYTPLLAGLCGTVVGLMSLLRSDPDTMPQHLAGVLLGTLSGAGATLIAGSAVSWLDGRVLSSKRAVSTLLFRKLLPTIPARTIAIAIEESVLAIIEARSQALVADISRLLSPLAESLSLQARESTEAAANASKTLETAVRIVESAPVLAKVTAQLIKASVNTQAASERLAADAERLAALHEAETVAAKTVEGASRNLIEAVEKLSHSTEAIRVGVLGGPPSLTAAVQSVDGEAKRLSTQVSLVATKVGDLNQELIGLSSELKGFGAGQVEALGKRLEDQARQLVAAVREQLEGSPGRTSDALQRVGTSAEALAGRIKAATTSLEELERRSEALVAFVNRRIQTVVSPTAVTTSAMNLGPTAERGYSTTDPTSAQNAASLAESASSLREILSWIQAAEARKRRPSMLRRTWRRIRIRRSGES